MSVVADLMDWLALALAIATVAVALGALATRSLFVMCVQLAAAGALGAAAVLALRAGDAALLLALFVATWAPVLLLATMLLTSRTTRPARGAKAWLNFAAAIVVFAVLMLLLPDLGGAVSPARGDEGGVAALFAPLLLAT